MHSPGGKRHVRRSRSSRSNNRSGSKKLTDLEPREADQAIIEADVGKERHQSDECRRKHHVLNLQILHEDDAPHLQWNAAPKENFQQHCVASWLPSRFTTHGEQRECRAEGVFCNLFEGHALMFACQSRTGPRQHRCRLLGGRMRGATATMNEGMLLHSGNTGKHLLCT